MRGCIDFDIVTVMTSFGKWATFYNNSFKLTAKSFLRTYVRSDKLVDRENPKEGPRKRSYEIHLTQLRVDAIFRMYSAIYLFEIDIFFDRVPF